MLRILLVDTTNYTITLSEIFDSSLHSFFGKLDKCKEILLVPINSLLTECCKFSFDLICGGAPISLACYRLVYFNIWYIQGWFIQRYGPCWCALSLFALFNLRGLGPRPALGSPFTSRPDSNSRSVIFMHSFF